jgi:2-phospho-L-lactate guanylyltransferase
MSGFVGPGALFTAIIPIRSWGTSKTRLHDDVSIRVELARAFALDTVESAIRARLVGRVVVVTDDPDVTADVRALGARVVRERFAGHEDPLNAALHRARLWSAHRHTHEPVVVVPSDLPALTPGVLDHVLLVARGEQFSFVPDARGSGTTLLAAAEPRLLEHAYGADSARAHEDLGAVRLDGAPAAARHDVDTLDDLVRVSRLGMGSRTTASWLAMSPSLS